MQNTLVDGYFEKTLSQISRWAVISAMVSATIRGEKETRHRHLTSLHSWLDLFPRVTRHLCSFLTSSFPNNTTTRRCAVLFENAASLVFLCWTQSSISFYHYQRYHPYSICHNAIAVNFQAFLSHNQSVSCTRSSLQRPTTVSTLHCIAHNWIFRKTILRHKARSDRNFVEGGQNRGWFDNYTALSTVKSLVLNRHFSSWENFEWRMHSYT